MRPVCSCSRNYIAASKKKSRSERRSRRRGRRRRKRVRAKAVDVVKEAEAETLVLASRSLQVCVCVVRVGAIHRLDRSRVRVRVCEQNTERPLAGQQATPSTTTPSSSLSPFRDSCCASGWTRTRCHSKPHPQLLSDLLNTASQAAPSPPIRCHHPLKPHAATMENYQKMEKVGEGQWRVPLSCICVQTRW